MSFVKRLIGLLLMVACGYVLLHLDRYLPGLVAAQGSPNPEVCIGMACSLTPGAFIIRLSPRYGEYDFALTADGFWVLPGYFMPLLSVVIFMLFR